MSLGAVLVLLSAASATARPRLLGTPSPTARQSADVCAADIKMHCGDVQPGDGRVGACVKEHLGDLSERCRQSLGRAAAVVRACAPDVKKECADVRRGRFRIAACLQNAIANLSDTCKAASVRAVIGRR